MSGRRPTNLTRRQGVYYFRGFIPVDLHAPTLRREVRVSLRTRDALHARLCAQQAGIAFIRLCAKLRAMAQAGVSQSDLVETLRGFGAHYIGGALPPPSYAGPNVDRDTAVARFWAEEQIEALGRAVQDRDFSSRDIDVENPLPATRRMATELANRLGLPADLSDPQTSALHVGVARAQIAERKQFLRRLDDPLAPDTVDDELFAVASRPARVSGPPQLTFAEATQKYLASKSGVAWVRRTQWENERLLRIAAEHFGADTALNAITREHVRAFRDGLLTWRKKPPADVTLSQLTGAAPGDRISAKSASKYLGYLTAAFNFWVREGFLDTSPVGQIGVQLPHSMQATSRRPFAPADLAALYSSPIFTGCAGPSRRTWPGNMVIKDGFYWILVIAPLSGLRITELVQLAADDINFDDPVPAFRVRGDAARGQMVKSDAGWRSVPVHRRLLELGFREFVLTRQAELGTRRLFFDVPVSETTGGAGGEMSKLFGRTMKRLKLNSQGLVFHSFRHTFIDQLREHGAPDYVLKRVVGHASKSVTDGYGSGASLKACRDWIDKIDILDQLPPV